MPYAAKIVEVERCVFWWGIETFRIGRDVIVEVIADDWCLVERYKRVQRSRC